MMTAEDTQSVELSLDLLHTFVFMGKWPFMKEHSISISEAQNKITQLPEQFGEEPIIDIFFSRLPALPLQYGEPVAMASV